jgi:NADPH:quinone reductase-like Zn-dependent oxidoreductase
VIRPSAVRKSGVHPASVVGATSMRRGLFGRLSGTTEDHLALKPTRLSFEQSAAVPISCFAVLQGLRDEARSGRGRRS